MTNTNCLEGIQCPQCGSEDRFRIAATSIFTVTDDGTEDHGDVEWDDDSHAECAACRHRGTLKDFRAAAGYFLGGSGQRYAYAEIAARIRKEVPHTLGKHIFVQLEAIGLLDELTNGTTPCGLPLTFADAPRPMTSYHITAWCDRTFTTVFDVEAESAEQALAIARERAHDEPAEECNDCYPWDTFSVADGHGIELLAWAEDEVTLRDAADALLNACRLVLDRWERGDLAEAARACRDAVAMATADALPPDEARTVRIEVRGGVVQEVSNVPPGWAYQIVDYDDAEANA